MISYIIFSLGISSGFVLGSFFKGTKFDNQNWIIMKWNSEALGFRPVVAGSKLFKGDRVALSLEVDTCEFPENGLLVE